MRKSNKRNLTVVIRTWQCLPTSSLEWDPLEGLDCWEPHAMTQGTGVPRGS